GCAGGLALLDALTSTSSHELCEAITDPVPGDGWYDDQNGEIGDICARGRPAGSATTRCSSSGRTSRTRASEAALARPPPHRLAPGGDAQRRADPAGGLDGQGGRGG